MYFSAPLIPFDWFGSSVSSIDVDKDGLYDLVVGARGMDTLQYDVGGAFVLYLDWSKYNCWKQPFGGLGIQRPLLLHSWWSLVTHDDVCVLI